MFSGVSFSGKHGTKTNEQTWSEGPVQAQRLQSLSSHCLSRDQRQLQPKHTHGGWAPAVRQDDFRPCCSAYTRLRRQLLPLQLLPVFLLDRKDLKTRYKSFYGRNTILERKLKQKVERAKGLSSTPLSYTRLLPSLLHPTSTWDLKGGDQLVSHSGYPEQGTWTLQSVWGFPPPLGETHLLPKLYFALCTDATQMASQSICLKLLYLPGGHLCRGRGEGKGGLALLGEGLAQFIES